MPGVRQVSPNRKEVQLEGERMQPTFAWLDFNTAERERTQRILALFEERETRDELGLGAIRDSFADHLFPGTSTIQTRLRYLFFVPWIYQDLERRRIPAR